MNVNKSAKPTIKLLALTAATALSVANSAKGSITWVNMPDAAYSANTTTTFNALTPTESLGVTVDFSSNISGTLGLAGTTAEPTRQINLTTTSLISAGTTLSFDFDFNMQIASGGAGKRAATQFRMVRPVGLAPNPAIDADLFIYGGTDTLENYFDGPMNDNAALLWENTDVLQATGSGNVSFDGFPFSNSSTAGFSATAQNAQTFINIFDSGASTQDFSLSGIHYDVTLGGDLAAGTQFLFTLGGVPIGPVIPVPEPSHALLLTLGLASLTLLRRRK